MKIKTKGKNIWLIFSKDGEDDRIQVAETDEHLIVSVPFEYLMESIAKGILELDKEGKLAEMVGGPLKALAVKKWAEMEVK